MEKEEFLRLLPKLIREDDEVKGAIISALSGVMATKEDIQRVIEHSDRRFEALRQQMDERFAKMDERFAKMDDRITKNQEILISHSESLKFIIQNMPNIQNLKNIDLRMTRLENLSSTQFKTLDGKMDTKFEEINEKLDSQAEDISEIKKILSQKQ
ncbi:MAG: hypothetical protein ACTSR8_20985 [Promethearchaeota archaeon]